MDGDRINVVYLDMYAEALTHGITYNGAELFFLTNFPDSVYLQYARM